MCAIMFYIWSTLGGQANSSNRMNHLLKLFQHFSKPTDGAVLTEEDQRYMTIVVDDDVMDEDEIRFHRDEAEAHLLEEIEA